MEIDKSILDKSRECEWGFACLTNENHHCFHCIKEVAANGKVLFTKCAHTTCGYLTHFGSNKICGCPVRNEIYWKYKK